MIQGYLNQIAIWKKRTGQMDAYGNDSFQTHTIKVRWEFKRRMVRDKEGREVVSECRVFTKEKVSHGDRLIYDGQEYPVISHSIAANFDGREAFREVSV